MLTEKQRDFVVKMVADRQQIYQNSVDHFYQKLELTDFSEHDSTALCEAIRSFEVEIVRLKAIVAALQSLPTENQPPSVLIA